MATSNGLIRNQQDEIAFLTKYIASKEADLSDPQYALPGYQKQLLTQIAASKEQLAGVEKAVAEAPAVAAAQPTVGSTSGSGPIPVAPGPGTTGTVVTAAATPTAAVPVSVTAASNTAVTKEDPAKPVRVVVSGVGPPKIIPAPNVLDKYSSYTYQASVYLLTPVQFLDFQNGNRIIPDSQLLFQSGGKAAGTGNKFFDHDFYIDNITIETRMPGKQTQGAHMATDIRFTITEPMGITLIDRLKNAVAAIQPNSKSSWAAAHYVMKISFFGYDEKGNLVSPGTPVTAGTTQNPKAVIVKYIPFVVKELNWSVGNKLVNYEFTGAPIGQVTGGSSARGTGSSDFQITASTVGELFGARSIKSSDAPTPNPPPATTGLAGALNKQAERAANQSNFKQPDTYNIVFVDAEEIYAAKLKAPEQQDDKKRQAMALPSTESGNSKNLDSTKAPVSNLKQSYPIPAGSSIVSVLDLVMRDSTYITGKQITTNTADGSVSAYGQSVDGDPPTWYLITYSAKPKQYDDERKDFAYDITYTITRYVIPNLHSSRFPVLKTFPGLHKEYKYWFTGENSAVLDYSAKFDSMYKMTTNGHNGTSSFDALRATQSSSKNDLWDDDKWAMKQAYAPRSSQPTGYGSNNQYEGSANAAEYLYSPSTLATSKIRIVGDPAWIQQGSLVGSIEYNKAFGTEAAQGFTPDGTISFDTIQALYEIAWQRPEDYDLSTGLADPYVKTYQKYGEREPLQSNIYQAVKVISEFRNGQFEQTIDGAICIFKKPKPTTSAEQYSAADNSRKAITESTNSRTQAATASSSNRFGTNTNAAVAPAASASVISSAASSTGTIAAPVADNVVQSSGANVPTTTAAQYAALDSARTPVTEVPNIVPALPPAPPTSNGQTVGGYGFGLNVPPVLNVGAGRTSIDALQAAAVNVPPYLTRRDA